METFGNQGAVFRHEFEHVFALRDGLGILSAKISRAAAVASWIACSGEAFRIFLEDIVPSDVEKKLGMSCFIKDRSPSPRHKLFLPKRPSSNSRVIRGRTAIGGSRLH